MRQSKIQHCYAALFLLVIAFIAYVGMTYNNTESGGNDWNSIIDYNQGWSLNDQETVAIPLTMKTKRNDTYRISNVLPEIIKEGSVLAFKSDHLIIHAYVGEEEIYSLTADEHGTIGKSPGLIYAFIPLDHQYSGKKITIEYTCVYSRASFHINGFWLGDKTAIITRLLRHNVFAIVLCVAVFWMGIIFVTAYILNHKSYEMKRSLLYLGLFALPFSAWSVTETQVMQFFFKNAYSLQYVTYLSLSLTALPFLYYFAEEHQITDRKAVRFIGSYQVLVIALCLSLQGIGIADLPETLVLVHSAIGLVIIYCFYQGLLGLYHNRTHKVLFLKKFSLQRFSLIVLLICTVIDLFRYYLTVNEDYSRYVRVGFFLYLGCTGLEMIFDSARITKENKQLERLVYLNEETGLWNKAAYQKQIEIMQQEDAIEQNYGIVKLNIRSLDELPPESGYRAKAECIRCVARMIERAFRNLGTIYQLEEGQFMILLEKNIEENYNTGLNVLNKRVHNSNKSRDIKIVLSHVFAVHHLGEAKTIDGVLDDLETSHFQNNTICSQ